MRLFVVLLGLLLAWLSTVRGEGPYIFYGKFLGKCEMGKDGLYYRDELTFIVCSHGNSYVQPCPKGTKNAEYNDFFHGKKYHYNQFCDINLVDQTIVKHALPHGSYKPPTIQSANKYGGQHGGGPNSGTAYGTNSKQPDNVYRAPSYNTAAHTYGGASYGTRQEQVGGNAGSGYNADNTYQNQGRSTYQYHAAPMSLEERYNTFFNNAGFNFRNPFTINRNYRFRAYPHYN